MNKKSTSGILTRWAIISYLALVIEKLCFLGSLQVMLLRRGDEHMGMGLFLVHILVLPFQQTVIWYIGGKLAMYAVLTFAVTSFMLSWKPPRNIVPIIVGPLALIFCVLWDLDTNPVGVFEFWANLGGQIIALVLVALLGIYSDRLFNRFTMGFKGSNEE